MRRLPLALGVLSLSLLACRTTTQQTPAAAMPLSAARTALTSGEAKVANAMSAAPPSVSANATIRDWPSQPGGAFPVLRQGTNGWTCLPSNPQSKGNEPMCLDAAWMRWVEAFASQTAPPSGQTGIAYMIGTDGEVSNTDPHAAGPTSTNQWHRVGSHVMLLLSSPQQYDQLSAEPHNGGPYVMWKGTPLVHVMVPVP